MVNAAGPSGRIDWLRLILVALALCQALFASVPSLDIRVSSLFFDARAGFRLAHIPALVALRDGLRLTPWVVGIGAAGLALVQCFRPMRLGIEPCALIFTSLVLGPGLIVNGVLKEYWGRARPDAIIEFGGTAHFTPAFQIASECARNCSFTSGEAASLSTTAMALSIAAFPLVARGRWMLATCVLGIVAGGGAFLRVMMGRHFLSDIVFSFLICALVILGVQRVLDAVFARPGPIA